LLIPSVLVVNWQLFKDGYDVVDKRVLDRQVVEE
jgi:hypothetical protein